MPYMKKTMFAAPSLGYADQPKRRTSKEKPRPTLPNSAGPADWDVSDMSAFGNDVTARFSFSVVGNEFTLTNCQLDAGLKMKDGDGTLKKKGQGKGPMLVQPTPSNYYGLSC